MFFAHQGFGLPLIDVKSTLTCMLNSNTISGLILLSISGWTWWQASSFPVLDDGYPGPALFPQVIAVSLALAGLYLVLKKTEFSKTTSTTKPARSGRLAGAGRLFVGLALTALYPILIQFTHFIPLMAMLIFFVALLLKNPAWHALLMSVLSAALIYGLFTQLLSVPL